ncbi:MAG TPA: hypothetical protein PKN80_00245 [bacterium]|uniref:MORN repeat variant n=1 Tax=candidate division TA06 bacterium ADurb.Bin417 TaxID=1852828 RepID=A0A1V5MJN8_UNCT6|nr:MAG: hypothetical protein BWY73_00299 [candidate division TA06 bacterium ADurb.Bin417]HNQ34481.1 hypothetical protein [bacterium]HNS48344.1 hypothetical protein [bacterium]
MGTWTYLSPFSLGYKLSDDFLTPYAPPLWFALFSSADVFIDQDQEGDFFASVETSAGKARGRVRKILRRIRGDAYAETLLAPLRFFELALSGAAAGETVQFDLLEWGDDFSLAEARQHVEGLTEYMTPFDDFIQGLSPFARLLKLLSGRFCLGSLEKDKRALEGITQNLEDEAGMKMSLAEYAFGYLAGFPVTDDSPEGKRYYAWVEANRPLWEGGSGVKGPQVPPAEEAVGEPVAEAGPAEEAPPEKERNGLVREYYDSDGPAYCSGRGRLASVSRYKDGRLHGLCKRYEYLGKKRLLVSQLRYKNGRLDGLCKYYVEGELVRSSHFRNGRLNGIVKNFGSEYLFKNGKIVKTLYSPCQKE